MEELGDDSEYDTDEDGYANAVARGRSQRRDDARPPRRSLSRRGQPTGRWQDNPCKHCKKYKRRNQHPNIPEEECFWNKKYTGYRPKGVCDEMEIKFIPRHRFEDDE